LRTCVALKAASTCCLPLVREDTKQAVLSSGRKGWQQVLKLQTEKRQKGIKREIRKEKKEKEKRIKEKKKKKRKEKK